MFEVATRLMFGDEVALGLAVEIVCGRSQLVFTRKRLLWAVGALNQKQTLDIRAVAVYLLRCNQREAGVQTVAEGGRKTYGGSGSTLGRSNAVGDGHTG